nr:ATP synthase F0 subunit 8 [Ornithodoros pavimentosus]AIZ58688.1 ATP synthase F0 subunit 8 [Ornithodoros pavimentosus]
MPQLFPMNWNLLCILFTLMMMISMMLTYFNKIPKTKTYSSMKNTFQKNWKW